MSTDSPQSSERYGGDTRITPAMEDYLKAIYAMEHDGHAVTTQRLAGEMRLSGASVTNMLKRLNDLNLVAYLPYRGVSLTPAGTAVALEVVRHHRLLELYLSQALGFDIEQVHDEADRLEHHVSEELESRMEQALGFPEFDPHGHPIPTRTGNVPSMTDIALTELPVGEAAIVSRVSDRDPSRLRQINHWGIRPRIEVVVVGRSLAAITTTVAGETVEVPINDAALIHVSPGIRRATS